MTGALYSHLSVGDLPGAWLPAAIALALISGAYVAYRRRLNQQQVLTGSESMFSRGTASAGDSA